MTIYLENLEETEISNCNIQYHEDHKVIEENTVPEEYNNNNKTLIVRLDKWLWAARFFKTRPLANIAVDRGDVLLNDKLTTPNKEIYINDVLTIRQGKLSKKVIITELSTRRRNSDDALKLYKTLNESNSEFALQHKATKSRNYLTRHDNFMHKKTNKKPVRFLRRSLQNSYNSDNI